MLITHGHYYYVNTGIEDIEREAEGRGCDIVMFGHTHRPIIDYHKDVIALNPGDLSYPRQEGKDHLILLWILIKKERQRLKLSIYRRKDLEKSGIRAIRKS